MSTNTYNRKIGHSKHSSWSLEEKIKHKKVMRKNKKMTERFKGIVKNFGATETALNGLYEEAKDIVMHFRGLEEDAEGLSGDEFDKRCDELASLEEEYEEKCAFLDFLEMSEITFIKKKKEEKGTIYKSSFEVLTPCDVSIPDTPEISLNRADEYYWNNQYKKGRCVFFGWLKAIRNQKSKLKERFAGGGWKTPSTGEVFNIRAHLEEKPKVPKKRLGAFGKKKK